MKKKKKTLRELEIESGSCNVAGMFSRWIARAVLFFSSFFCHCSRPILKVNMTRCDALKFLQAMIIIHRGEIRASRGTYYR